MSIITPTVQVKLDAKLLTDLVKRVKDLQDCYVEVGVFEGAGKYEDGTSVVAVALFNEFGTERIPERSFIRSAINGNVDKINAWRTAALNGILEKGMAVEEALKAMGVRIALLVTRQIIKGVPPPNAPSTQAKKRAAGVPQRTLQFTGLMLRSVGYRVYVHGDEVYASAPGEVGGTSGLGGLRW